MQNAKHVTCNAKCKMQNAELNKVLTLGELRKAVRGPVGDAGPYRKCVPMHKP